MTVPKIERPTLYRPDLIDPDDPRLKVLKEKEAAKVAAEAPLRATLEGMSREQLIDLAIAGAWETKRLWALLERLRDKNVANRRARQKGATNKLANDKRQGAKREIEKKYKSEAASGRKFVAAEFARRMSDEHMVITDPRTIEGWVREWRKGRTGAQKASSPTTTRDRPEIYLMLGYFDRAELLRDVD